MVKPSKWWPSYRDISKVTEVGQHEGVAIILSHIA